MSDAIADPGPSGRAVLNRVKDFESAALTGTYAELERARFFAVAAFEAFLDAQYAKALALLRSWGQDPSRRPRR